MMIKDMNSKIQTSLSKSPAEWKTKNNSNRNEEVNLNKKVSNLPQYLNIEFVHSYFTFVKPKQ